MQAIRDYLAGMIAGFVADPADSDYQEGYEAAVRDIYLFVKEAQRNG